MDKFSLYIADNDTSFDKAFRLITNVLESGHSVELTASGFSMFPTFKPGNKIVVRPLPKGAIPKIGNVVVYEENGRLVMHRLVKINEKESGLIQFISYGDSRSEPDEPWYLPQLLGVAVSYKKGKREYPVRSFIPRRWQYKFNGKLLCYYWKFLWIKNKLFV